VRKALLRAAEHQDRHRQHRQPKFALAAEEIDRLFDDKPVSTPTAGRWHLGIPSLDDRHPELIVAETHELPPDDCRRSLPIVLPGRGSSRDLESPTTGRSYVAPRDRSDAPAAVAAAIASATQGSFRSGSMHGAAHDPGSPHE